MEKQLIRMFPIADKPLIIVVSNDGQCMEVALEAARALDSVDRTEVDESAGNPPHLTPSSSNNPQQDQGPFKYRIITATDADREHLIPQLQAHIQHALDTAACNAHITIEA